MNKWNKKKNNYTIKYSKRMNDNGKEEIAYMKE